MDKSFSALCKNTCFSPLGALIKLIQFWQIPLQTCLNFLSASPRRSVHPIRSDVIVALVAGYIDECFIQEQSPCPTQGPVISQTETELLSIKVLLSMKH